MTKHRDLEPAREWLEGNEIPGTGRGIVICAGGVQMFTNAWVLVWLLRKELGCRLPIEVWHLGSAEMSTGMRSMLEGLGSKIVDAHEVLSRFPARIADGWQLKPYALIMSGFREVLMLDADNVPTVDPSFLFDSPEFSSTGAIFWSDVLDVSKDNPIWRELGLPSIQRTSFETGQVLIDKGRHGTAMTTVLRLNEDAERYYQLVYGDKDTFLAGWLLASAAHQLVPYRPIADRHVLYQRDFTGRIVFQHRTNGKWKYSGQQAQSEGFIHGESCEKALAALRRIWNGRIFEPPSRSSAAMRIERSMEGRTFVAARPGQEDRQFELIANCQIGEGRDFEHETWYVIEPEAGSFLLRIIDRHRTRYELLRRDDKHWIESGASVEAMSFTAIEATAKTATGVLQHDWARTLCEAALRGEPWTRQVGEQLRLTVELLCRLDPLLADELAEYASGATELDDGTREGLLHIAAEQKRLIDAVPQRRDMRSDTNILFDLRHYVRP